MGKLSKLQWKQRKKIAEATRAVLVERFPRCFCAKGAPKTPLKVGIYQDLRDAAPDLVRRHLRLALADYTSGRTYKRQLVAGAARVDLDGWPAGEVTEADEAEAKARLAKSEKYPGQAHKPETIDA